MRAIDLFEESTQVRARRAAATERSLRPVGVPTQAPKFDLRRESHVWMVDARDVSPTRLAQYEALLDDEELDRSHGRPAGDRRMFIIVRALVRTALSHYAPVSPKDWKFAAGPYGRPYIAGPAGAPALNFSVTCTGHYAFVLVTTGPYAAIDAERFRRIDNVTRIARSYYAPAEAAAVGLAAKDERNELFFTLWSLKEAYLKARGYGTMVPLPGATFTVEGAAIDFELDDSMEDDAGRWDFQLLHPTPDTVVTVALSSAHALTSRLRCFRAVPLESETPVDVKVSARTHAGFVGNG
ncbi:MAG TPA: 4'-phosphopantetheinyl transferase superfamily protein [Polyangia bacterium]